MGHRGGVGWRSRRTIHQHAYPILGREGFGRILENLVRDRYGGSIRKAARALSRLGGGRRTIGRSQLSRYLRGEVSEVPRGTLALFLAAAPDHLQASLKACLGETPHERFLAAQRGEAFVAHSEWLHGGATGWN